MIKLKVDYSEKEIVKQMGARWNVPEKYWYVPDYITDVECFKRYIPHYEEAVQKHQQDVENYQAKHLMEEELPFPDLDIIENYKYSIPELKDIDFVVLDTETTGTGMDDEITELGIIDSNGKEVYRSLFNVRKQIPHFVQEINGITNAKLIGKPRMINEWENIKKAINGRIIIAYNTPFDKRMVIQTIKQYGGNEAEAKALFENCLDAMLIYCKYMNLSSCKLQKAAKDNGVEIVQTHRATDDCLMTLKVLQLLDEKIKTRQISSNPFKEQVKNCLLDKKFNIDDMAIILNCDAQKIEDCIIKEFTMNELKDIPGFRFDYYYTPYEFIRITAHITKKGWNHQYRTIKKVFPDISYRAIKFIVKAFKKAG